MNSIELFQILSIYAMIRSVTSPAGALLLSRGRADIGFWWSIGEFMLMPFIIYISSHWGITGIAFGLLIFQTIMLLPNWYFIVHKMCTASFKEYFLVQLQPLLAILISVSFTYLIINNIELNNIFKVVIFSFIGLGLYFLFSYWLNRSFVKEIKNIFIKKGEA